MNCWKLWPRNTYVGEVQKTMAVESIINNDTLALITQFFQKLASNCLGGLYICFPGQVLVSSCSSSVSPPSWENLAWLCHFTKGAGINGVCRKKILLGVRFVSPKWFKKLNSNTKDPKSWWSWYAQRFPLLYMISPSPSPPSLKIYLLSHCCKRNTFWTSQHMFFPIT